MPVLLKWRFLAPSTRKQPVKIRIVKFPDFDFRFFRLVADTKEMTVPGSHILLRERGSVTTTPVATVPVLHAALESSLLVETIRTMSNHLSNRPNIELIFQAKIQRNVCWFQVLKSKKRNLAL